MCFQVSLTPIKDAGGFITNYVAVLQDVTERKSSEAAFKLRDHALSNLSEVSLWTPCMPKPLISCKWQSGTWKSHHVKTDENWTLMGNHCGCMLWHPRHSLPRFLSRDLSDWAGSEPVRLESLANGLGLCVFAGHYHCRPKSARLPADVCQ